MKVNIKVFSSDCFKLIFGFPLKEEMKNLWVMEEQGAPHIALTLKYDTEKNYLEAIPFPCLNSCYLSPECS